MLRNILIYSLFLRVGVLLAQPVNVDCASATLLCAGQPMPGTNSGATVLPGLCNTRHTVWYHFTTNSVGGSALVQLSGIDCPAVAGMGGTLAFSVLSGDGSCTLANFQTVPPGCASGDLLVELNTVALAPATTYWIVVGGTLDAGATAYAECDFSITVSGPGVDVVGVDMSAGPDHRIFLGGTAVLQASGGTGHTWNPPVGLSTTTGTSPMAFPQETTTYTVSAQVGGCTFTDQAVVEVVRAIAPPNTFTPNGDGYNDTWLIPGIQDFPQADVRIFDRWGQRVYQSIGYREPFDGAGLPTATYYWFIDLNDLSGSSDPYSGTVTIIR